MIYLTELADKLQNYLTNRVNGIRIVQKKFTPKEGPTHSLFNAKINAFEEVMQVIDDMEGN